MLIKTLLRLVAIVEASSCEHLFVGTSHLVIDGERLETGRSTPNFARSFHDVRSISRQKCQDISATVTRLFCHTQMSTKRWWGLF
jgi:hypothetical protein